MRFRCKTMSLSQLGELFGATSHDVGKWLVDVGLRNSETKKPSWEAYHNGYYVNASKTLSFPSWEWDAELTVAKLKQAGHNIIATPPESLVGVPPLNGPFRLQGNDVINTDGTLAARAATRRNAEALHRLLDLAHRAGALNKLTTAKAAC